MTKPSQFKTRAAAEHHKVTHDLDQVVREIWSEDDKVIGYGLFDRNLQEDRPVEQPTFGELGLKTLRGNLATHVFPEYRYAWGRYYPLRASSALVAEGAVGKSTLILSQMIHGALGKPYLGAPTLEGLYIYLSFEDDFEIVERRAQKIMKAFTDIERAQVQQNFMVLDGVGKGIRFVAGKGIMGIDPMVDKVIALLADAAEGRSIVHCAIDTLVRVAGGDENASEVMSALEQASSRIAQALDCACTYAHHTSKAVAREGVADAHSGRGSAALGDNCRSVLRLMPLTKEMVAKARFEGLDADAIERGDIIKLVHAKLNIDRKAEPVYLQRTADGLLRHIEPHVRTDEEIQAAQDERERNQITALLIWHRREDEPFTISRVSRTDRLQWTRMPQTYAKAFIERLIFEGKLVEAGELKGHKLYAPSADTIAEYSPEDPFET